MNFEFRAQILTSQTLPLIPILIVELFLLVEVDCQLVIVHDSQVLREF